MRTHTLKMNYNHLKQEIETDFLSMRHVFYTSLALCIVYLDGNTRRYLSNATFEDSAFRSLTQDILGAVTLGYSPFEQLGLGKYPYLVEDMIVYLDEFLSKHHHHTLLNIYNLTIDEKYNIVITNKQVRHAHQNTLIRD